VIIFVVFVLRHCNLCAGENRYFSDPALNKIEMPKKEPRVRTDTFWKMVDTKIVDYFQKIYDGSHEIYGLDKSADVNLDYKGKPRHCWAVRRLGTAEPGPIIDGLLSTCAYRVSLLWSINTDLFWTHEKRRLKRKAQAPTVRTKYANHTRHRCPNEWCCNPRHLLIGSRTTNEVDKHFHYFLKHVDEENSNIKFMDTFRELCHKQRVWGFYSPQ